MAQTSVVHKNQGTSALADSSHFSKQAFLNKSSVPRTATANDYVADRSGSSSFRQQMRQSFPNTEFPSARLSLESAPDGCIMEVIQEILLNVD